MKQNLRQMNNSQYGFTLIEMMIVTAIIGVLATISVFSYQNYVRKAQIMSIYKEINHFRVPYQILMDDGDGVTSFSPDGLNMPTQAKYCQFSVTGPNANATTSNAVQCHIQNLNYLSNQTLSLDRGTDGNWTCRASSGIARTYLPQACQ